MPVAEPLEERKVPWSPPPKSFEKIKKKNSENILNNLKVFKNPYQPLIIYIYI